MPPSAPSASPARPASAGARSTTSSLRSPSCSPPCSRPSRWSCWSVSDTTCPNADSQRPSRRAARRRRCVARRVDGAGGPAHRPPRRASRPRLGAVARHRAALRPRSRVRGARRRDGRRLDRRSSPSIRWLTRSSARSTRPRSTSPALPTRSRPARRWGRWSSNSSPRSVRKNRDCDETVTNRTRSHVVRRVRGLAGCASRRPAGRRTP